MQQYSDQILWLGESTPKWQNLNKSDGVFKPVVMTPSFMQQISCAEYYIFANLGQKTYFNLKPK